MSIDQTARRLVRRAMLAAATCAALATAAHAELDGVEIIAPAGPGGGYDQLARAVQATLQESGLASSVQVINVPGAGGTIGLAQFVNGPSRGSPLIVTGLGMVGAIDVNKSPVSLDQAAPLARMTGEYQPLVVGADSPIKTLDDLAAMYKADPGSVTWGGFALGSPDHLVSAMTVKAFGGDVKQMNYIVAGAGGEMLSQVLGGHITVATGGYNEFAGLIETGELRALAISSPERLPGVDIPTFKELGYDVELVNWRGLLTKADLGDEDRAALDATIGEHGEVRRLADALSKERGWVDMYQDSETFAAFLAEEQTAHRPDPRRARPRRVVTRWRPALRSAARCRHTGSRRASSKDRCMQAALDWLRAPRPALLALALAFPAPTAAQQAEASATFGPASAASHLHVRGATDIAALAPVVLAFLETLPGLRVTVRIVEHQRALRGRRRDLPVGRARGRPADELGRRPVRRAGQRRLRTAAPVGPDRGAAGLAQLAQRALRRDPRAGGHHLQPRPRCRRTRRRAPASTSSTCCGRRTPASPDASRPTTSRRRASATCSPSPTRSRRRPSAA